MRQEAIGEAHSKLILVGEHIVVYNKPAIAIPCPLTLRARIKERNGEITISSQFYTGSIYDMPDRAKGILECVKRSFELCNKPMEGVQIEIQSDIPVGRGLGSSAASATAIVRGIYKYFNKDITTEELFSLVELAESYAHGRPSGIDMMAVVREEPIMYQRTEGASSLIAPKPFHVVVADTGTIGDTKKAVSHVKKMRSQRPWEIDHTMAQIEEIVIKAKESILTGDSELLGSLLTRNHEKLRELGVSVSSLDRLVEVAIRLGALGAKLTGGGMGGCIIALAKDIESAKTISTGLMENGATKVWYFSTNSKNWFTVHSGICVD